MEASENEPVGSGMPTVFVDAEPFSWRWFAGIPRYAARLTLSIAAQGARVRFFLRDQEIDPLPGLSWSPDQDIEKWARRVWHGERKPLGMPPASSLGLYCGVRGAGRAFPFEVSVLHDLCPLVVGWTFPEAARWGFERFFAEDLLESDVAISVSHSTKADAAWLCPMPQDRIKVAHSGMSLCLGTHRHRGRVRRSEHIGLAVSTVEPRKNARFLLDWFHSATALPPDAELWWVGRMGWLMSREELRKVTRPPGGRRVRFLGNVSDAALCRLYRRAAWTIYPSVYEGFGFPVVDSLRHGTPVLTSRNSSLREFDHEGVYFFDPRDPASVDDAWIEYRDHGPGVVDHNTLLSTYDWGRVARTVLDAYAEARAGRPSSPVRASAA
jgi:glycosyltransferase involved in cell wall biosynthesis